MENILIILTGLPGSGKTTVAKLLASKYDGVVLRTDVIRKEIFGTPKYTPDETQITYSEFFKRTEILLSEAKTVILDAVFAKKMERETAKTIGMKSNVKIIKLLVIAQEDIVKVRLENRTQDESDATYDTYLKLKGYYDPIEDDSYITIDNSGNLEELKNKINSLTL